MWTRFIRTIKERLWRYFTFTNTRRYLEILPFLVSAYNDSYHSSIKRSPNSVNQNNQELVWQALYGEQKKKQPKFQVHDYIRLSMTKMKFRKGYLPGWTHEMFQIAKVIYGSPVVYKIKDWNGELLEGTFYEQELQKINKTDNLFRIKHIVKKRRKKKQVEYLIKWCGYPDSFNSWVMMNRIQKLRLCKRAEAEGLSFYHPSRRTNSDVGCDVLEPTPSIAIQNRKSMQTPRCLV